MLEVIRVTGERLKEIGSILWRCIYSVSLTILGSLGFALVPQGIETLRLAAQPGWNFPLFLVAVAAWSLSAWYSARLTLGRVFGGTSEIDRSDTPFVNRTRKWLPRLLAVMPSTVLAIRFYQLGEVVFALTFAIVALMLGVFVVKRRAWFASKFKDGQSEQSTPVRFHFLQRETVLAVVSIISLSFALFIAIWWKPVEVTEYVTAPVLLCFALASWILFGDLVLTYSFKQARLPSMAALPLVLFVAFSGSNDNHGVSLIGGNQGPVIHRDPALHFNAWLEARRASGELRKDARFPVFLVGAEGGGIRAAYWAGIVLAKLQDDSNARFGRHVFALSGVSGGSLANAVFVALMAEARAGTLPAAPCAQVQPSAVFLSCARQVLRRDYLSPTVGYLLYPDMLQRFLPTAIPAADRARATEKAWQAGWHNAVGSDRLGQRFDRLWLGAADVGLPSLLLNATLVGGGNRVIASDLVIDGRFPDAYDAFDDVLDLRQMSLSSAVHNSARFSYVSPAGTVYACGDPQALTACKDQLPRTHWGRLIDGGYFENSGVETVRDLLAAMRPALDDWRARGFQIDPVVLVISNSPRALPPSGKQHPQNAKPDMPFLSELLAPPLGLFNTRTARATFAVAAERRDIGPILPHEPDPFVWFGMQTKNDTPLGWALADRTFNAMDELLKPPLADQLPFAAVLKRLPPPSATD
jgi:hypothetical protein